MVKRVVAALGVAAGGVLVLYAGPAGAHQHTLHTPGGKDVVIPCEPFHGTTPGQSDHSANWDETRGLHPIHWGLHLSPAAQERAVTVTVSNPSCP